MCHHSKLQDDTSGLVVSDLGWVIFHACLATMPLKPNSLSPGTVGQTVEHSKFRSTQPRSVSTRVTVETIAPFLQFRTLGDIGLSVECNID